MIRTAVVVACTWLAAMSSALAANLFGIAADSGNVYQINTANPSGAVFKFSLGAGKDFAGLAYSTKRRTFFAFSRAQNRLYEFNKSGAILSTVTVSVQMSLSNRGVAFDNLGTLFMIGAGNRLYKVSLTNGVATLQFQTTGATTTIESLAPLDNGAFLAVGGNNRVLVLDRSSRILTSIATLSTGDLDSMTGTIGGWIYMTESSATNSRLHAYNPFTRAYANLGLTGLVHLSSLEELPSNAK